MRISETNSSLRITACPSLPKACPHFYPWANFVIQEDIIDSKLQINFHQDLGVSVLEFRIIQNLPGVLNLELNHCSMYSLFCTEFRNLNLEWSHTEGRCVIAQTSYSCVDVVGWWDDVSWEFAFPQKTSNWNNRAVVGTLSQIHRLSCQEKFVVDRTEHHEMKLKTQRPYFPLTLSHFN